jgi:hypothetical protein
MARLESPVARLSGALAALIVFALLVVATVGAFFVTTRLKRSTPVVQRLTFPRYLSPNGDGRHDVVRIGFRIKRSDHVTVSLLSENGDEVRVLARDRALSKGRHYFRWDGRLSSGAVAPDGEYRVRVGLRKQGRSVISPRHLFVDTEPPRSVVRYVSPDVISPDGAGSGNVARLRFAGPTRSRPELLVFRTDLRSPRLVARRLGIKGSNSMEWNGRVSVQSSQRPAPPGDYALVVRTRDVAGNVGPVGLPPERGRLQGHPGIVVRYISARTPAEPVRAGSQASFAIQSDGRRYRWSVRRLGSSRSLTRGSSRRHVLPVHVPRESSGVLLLVLRAGHHRYETPFVVQGRRRRAVLVVLPWITWMARSALDVNGDGFPDLLPEDSEVSTLRPFAGSGRPFGFASETAPLLLGLAQMNRRYDVTTDLALASGHSRQPIRYGGILFAGPPVFYSRGIASLMRAYVQAGGRLAWLGTGGFTREVRLERRLLVRASAGAPARNALGERLRLHGEGLLTVLGDRIGFFRGVGQAFGPFPGLEESSRLPRGARLLASAGSEAGRPSLAVYRDGRGVVARLGAARFAAASRGSQPVQRIMRRLWTLLSR